MSVAELISGRVFYSGYVADKFAVWYARTRRNGVREPEDRLYLLAVTVVLCPAGLILWGVGAARGVHWAALVVGGGITACSTVIGSIIAMSYALDCYKDMSAETMLGTQMVRVSRPCSCVSLTRADVPEHHDLRRRKPNFVVSHE